MAAQQQPGDPQEQVGYWLATACSRHSIHGELLRVICESFPTARLLRLSFGLQSKVMVNVNVSLPLGTCHVSFIPIHPTAAAACVLQDTPTIVVRQPNKNSPLWDQEDLWQREGCATLTVVSMPFYWPPREEDQLYGHALPRPAAPEHQPTFGAMSLGSSDPLEEQDVALLLNLAVRTGRHVCHHISALLAALEGAGALPSEPGAQSELRREEEGEWGAGEDLDDDAMGFERALQEELPVELLGPAAASPAAAAAAAEGEGRARPGGPADPQQLSQQERLQAQAVAAALEAQAAALAAQAADPSGQHGAAAAQGAFRQRRGQGQGAAGAAQQPATQQLGHPLVQNSHHLQGSVGSPHAPGFAAAPPAAAAAGGKTAAGAQGQPCGPPAPFAARWRCMAYANPQQEQAFATAQGRARAKADACLFFLASVLPSLGALLMAPSALSPLRYSSLVAGPALLLLLQHPGIYLRLREWLLAGVAVYGALCAAHDAPRWAQPPSYSGYHMLLLLLRGTGLDFLLLAPLLLQMRMQCAVLVQALCLAVLLLRLPFSFTSTGPEQHADPIHILLLSCLLAAGAAAGLWLPWQWEAAQRGRFERGCLQAEHASCKRGTAASLDSDPAGR